MIPSARIRPLVLLSVKISHRPSPASAIRGHHGTLTPALGA